MIAVLDFGSQYTRLITRRLRELGVSSEIFPHDTVKDKLPSTTTGIIFSGGPAGVYDKAAPRLNKSFLKSDVPVLGICYGYQLLAHNLGGEVIPGDKKEYGRKIINVYGGALFKGLNKRETVWFSHGDIVAKLPSGFKVTALSEGKAAAFENGKFFGLQFHPEVDHTIHGTRILRNFIKVCNEKVQHTQEDVINVLVREIKSIIGGESVLVGVSGGIDSLVAALLLNRAVGKNLYPVFVDTGLMRKDEAGEVEIMYKSLGFKNFLSFDASSDFLRVLHRVDDPELKRKKIGHAFIKVFEKIAFDLKKNKGIKFLAQGTIYPDRIESSAVGTGGAKIKSHHNLTLPQKLNFQLIEPLKDFYKDEVRCLAKKMDVPSAYLMRHPFPGPGLAIRILGEVTKEKLEIIKNVDSVFISELRKSKLYNKIWQAFAVLIPVKTVGVMGDSRTYEYMVSLRAVTSIDGMTADWAKIPQGVLEKISSRIVNEVRGVNRVVYDITQKPPATIEYE